MDGEKREKKEPNSDLEELCKVWGLAEAEVVKSLLASYGIYSLFRGRVVQSVHAFSTDGLGEIKILVSKKDYEAAKKILADRPPLEKAEEE